MNNLYILLAYFPDCFVKKPRRCPHRLRFFPRTRKNIRRKL